MDISIERFIELSKAAREAEMLKNIIKARMQDYKSIEHRDVAIIHAMLFGSEEVEDE